jgi:hypothetical protein
MDIVAAIEHHERQAVGLGALMESRSDALDRYLGRPYGDEVEGRSQVVMRDVSDTVEWIKPSLLKVFGAGEDVCKFSPVGPEDEEQAEQETEYVNHILMQKNQGFLILHDWFHDALLQKNGYVLVSWEEESRNQLERYEGLSDDEFALLTGNEEIELVEHAEAFDGYQRTHSAAVRVVKAYGCPKVINVPPERVLVSTDWPGLDLQDCPFTEIIDYPTISELREDGFDVNDDITDASTTTDDEWEESRRDINLTGQLDREGIEATPEMRRVKRRRVWMRHDSDGDGIAELRRVQVVGTTVLEDEEDDLVPIACLTPTRQPHEHHGLSIADQVSDLQRIRTVLVRGFLDSMYLANSGRNAIDVNRVNIDDLLTSRVGGVVRVQGDPASAIFPLQHQHQGPAILQAVDYIDKVRESRTGVKSFGQGLDEDALVKTATGVDRVAEMAAQRIDMIARIFAETGVKALMLLIHAVALKHSRQAELIKIRDQWVPIDPRQWKHRRDLTVTVGLGTGNKDQLLKHLFMILQEQKQALALGLTRPELIYNTLAKMTQNAGFKSEDEFWSDPSRYPPPPPGPNPEQMKAEATMQIEQFKASNDAQKFQAESTIERERMQMQLQVDQQREEMQARQKQLELEQMAQLQQLEAQYKAQAEAQRLEFDRWKAELDASVKLQIAGMSAAPATSNTDAQIQQLGQVINQLMAEINAPAEVLRDQAGRVVGIKKGNTVRQIQRGPDGRAIGVQ